MKKIILALILMVCMAVPAMAMDLGNDIKLEGDAFLGYVVHSNSEMMANSQVVGDVFSTDGSQSKWGYMLDVRFLWKNTLRPWLYLQGISGYTTSNSWAMETQTLSIGMDYLFYNTKYGSAFARASYTNWQTSVDGNFWQVDVIAEPESDTWMVGLGWKF